MRHLQLINPPATAPAEEPAGNQTADTYSGEEGIWQVVPPPASREYVIRDDRGRRVVTVRLDNELFTTADQIEILHALQERVRAARLEELAWERADLALVGGDA